MKLRYHLSKNFGDALNPLIFNHFIPELLSKETDSVDLVGIGSILGFESLTNAPKKIVFSSGYAYGKVPKIDESYDIRCVRGPLTCDELRLDRSLAVTDGAILLPDVIKNNQTKKLYKFSYIPHWESSMKYDWKSLCEELDINFIDPRMDVPKVVAQILKSEVLLSEALHAAIVADAYRIPWIPVKSYEGINSFKWKDWTSSLNLTYKPNKINSLYGNTSFSRKVFKERLNYPFKKSTLSPFIKVLEQGQKILVLNKVKSQIEKLKGAPQYLSEESIFESKKNTLLELLSALKRDFS
ncbi:MAG: polysaccharide pyruvyl transferase family protein [Bacteroidota bacterium]